MTINTPEYINGLVDLLGNKANDLAKVVHIVGDQIYFDDDMMYDNMYSCLYATIYCEYTGYKFLYIDHDMIFDFINNVFCIQNYTEYTKENIYKDKFNKLIEERIIKEFRELSKKYKVFLDENSFNYEYFVKCILLL